MKKLISLIFLFFTNLSYAEDLMNIGENIFYNKEACVNCHILNAADGGNNQLSKEHVINIVTNGSPMTSNSGQPQLEQLCGFRNTRHSEREIQ